MLFNNSFERVFYNEAKNNASLAKHRAKPKIHGIVRREKMRPYEFLERTKSLGLIFAGRTLLNYEMGVSTYI